MSPSHSCTRAGEELEFSWKSPIYKGWLLQISGSSVSNWDHMQMVTWLWKLVGKLD
jgi:hypothetical protein